MTRTVFNDVFGKPVEVGDTVVAMIVFYGDGVFVIGEVTKITDQRVKIKNRPHAGFKYTDEFQIDDSYNRIVKVEFEE
jgi:hypothetical protein